MNIHYKNYPTDYIDRLQGQGKRHKARCFWEYQNDVQNKDVNSFGFYAKSWGGDVPMSKGTVHKWIGEFRDEISKFYDTMALLNMQHYSSVKKQSERGVNGVETKSTPKSPEKREFESVEETASERQVNKALNIYDDDMRAIREFDSFFFIYRQFNKYAGSKENAKQSFLDITDIEHRKISYATIFYLKDESVEKKVGAKRFLDDKVYLSYISMEMSVLVDGAWLHGVYSATDEVLMVGEMKYKFLHTKLVEKMERGEVKYGKSH